MPMSQHRPALAAILVAFVAVLTICVRPIHADAASPDPSPIASVALSYDGTSQGQCWIFAKKVVKEATGHDMGFDYRQGYFDAGAIEVSAAAAQRGDIIQIASDSDTSPSASYDGLHTAIILANLGGGKFDVIDSNQNYDGVVHQRPNYDPGASAARYGLTYHIYRITGTPSTAPALPALKPTAGATFTAGDHAITVTPGDVLRLRSGPSASAGVKATLPNGTPLTVTGDTVIADGYRWVKVSSPQGDGYVAAEFIAKDSPGIVTAGGASPTAAGSGPEGPARPLMQFRNIVPVVSADN